MAYRTVEAIIKDAIGDSLKVYENIPAQFVRQAVIFYNLSKPHVWRAFPWNTKKIEVSGSPDENGIITLNSDVDVVRAVAPLESDGSVDVMLWHEDAIRSLMNGEEIGSCKFDHLSDDDEGNRRIKVNSDDGATTYKILAFRRFERAEVNDHYNSDSPAATPYDYRVLTWKIDAAEASLVTWISNELKKWNGKEGSGDWKHGLNAEKKDLREQRANTQTVTPDEGNFGEMGEWS